MKRMLMLSVSAVLMLAVAVQAETIFETFDSDPTAGSWTTVGTAGSRFTWLDDLTTNGDGDIYNGGGYLETLVTRGGADFDRFSTALSQAYNQSQEFWWEFDTQTVNHQYRYQRALFGVFDSASPNNANIITNNYFRQQSSSGSSMKTHRLSAFDSKGANLFFNSKYVMNPREPYRVKMHYTYMGGSGTIAVEFWALNKTGQWDDVLVGSDSGIVLNSGQTLTFNQFGFGNFQSTANAQIQTSWVDNAYFSTDGPNTNYEEAAFVIEGISPALASIPSPPNEATDVPRDAVLSWTPGVSADKHDVYFGPDFSDVNSANASDLTGIYRGRYDVNSYTPPEVLDLGTTYYWRVDEVDGPPDYTVYRGSIWSFTTEPVGYAIENVTATASSSDVGKGPENTVNGSGLDDSGLLHGNIGVDSMWLSSMAGPQPVWIEFELDKVYKLHEMWVWNSNDSLEPAVGFGLKDVTIEYSVDGANYATLGATHEFARAPGTDDYAHNTTVDFSGAVAKYVRLTANSNWGGFLPQFGLSEVRLLYIPVRAREPSPDLGTTDVDLDVTLGFRAGREAATHDVYLSTDEQAVIDGTAAVTTLTEASYGPLSLDLGTTYYWKINEVNMAETPTTLDGDLWNFSTREYLVVEDFEAYNDLDPTDPNSNRIFNAWIDGYQVPTNGSIVGYEAPPFCEQTIVHSDKQSMPLSYDNTGAAAYSEAELTLSPSQNWTQAGAATFVLYFHGTEGNTGQLYVKVNGSKVVYNGDAGDIAKAEWQQWNIDLASLGIDLQNVMKLSIGIDGNGASGTLYIDNIRLYRSAPEPEAP